MSPAGVSALRGSRSRLLASTKIYWLIGLFAVSLSIALWLLLRDSNINDGESYEAELIAVLMFAVIFSLGIAARERALRHHTPANRRRRHQRSSSSSSGEDGEAATAAASEPLAVLDALERKLAEAHAHASTPEQHLETYRYCEEFLACTNPAMAQITLAPILRHTLRTRQERVRAIKKQHLLSWARGNSHNLMHGAQRRGRVSDRIEDAMSALDILERALREYPEEREIQNSLVAIRDYVKSVRIRYWVELAERADFKGQHTRALNRYQNALFYLGRDGGTLPEESGLSTEARLRGKIESLQARLEIARALDDVLSAEPGLEG